LGKEEIYLQVEVKAHRDAKDHKPLAGGQGVDGDLLQLVVSWPLARLLPMTVRAMVL
jgi:hypothetical protein